MHLTRVVVASRNPDKVAEIEAVLAALPHPIEVVRGHTWAEIEETEDTLAGNALLKAWAVHRATGIAALADDTGLEVDALGGAPGVRTARYAGPDATYAENVERLLGDMGAVQERTARFRTVVALVDDDGAELIVEGVLEGRITTARRGGGGFGYDPIFEVAGRTLAERTPEEKHRISHRGKAIRALAAAVRSEWEQA